ncbi:hypothetical protein BE04_44770 [Sorangium cellulosum]|uniref:Uncharacterized protein n=1 Tax=Sorangium cellulosum TaxID=56 RepID=A0A150PAR5_SORCE|nr:hypothetical protein [Sorangium cellulosum]KYF52783.1 hypothetical protein BE04_44770 [Sorangium cellulosum]
MRRLCVAALVPLVVGCSIVDPEDREELRRQIASMPSSEANEYKRWYMKWRAQRWLAGKDPNDEVGKVQCRDNEGGLWSGWYDRPNKFLSVEDVVNCLVKKANSTYLFCAEEFASWVVPDAKKEIEKLLPAYTDIECKYVWDFRYEPEKVDPKMVDPDAITPDDLIEALITLPGPPPGWVLPRFAPLLCPLGAGPGWGCPPRPSDSFPTGGEPTDPPGGDQP